MTPWDIILLRDVTVNNTVLLEGAHGTTPIGLKFVRKGLLRRKHYRVYIDQKMYWLRRGDFSIHFPKFGKAPTIST